MYSGRVPCPDRSSAVVHLDDLSNGPLSDLVLPLLQGCLLLPQGLPHLLQLLVLVLQVPYPPPQSFDLMVNVIQICLNLLRCSAILQNFSFVVGELFLQLTDLHVAYFNLTIQFSLFFGSLQ